ncbi:MAG: Rrf2 family transcriptional regulator [Clostridia bacterium]|nr:Rrf2 family transcriptional regulator [Clostridia bacterium]
MKITQECDYAIRIMVTLANLDKGQVIDAGSISNMRNIPSRFTVKILRKLVLSGLISSKKGANGGYSLKDKSQNITLLSIVEVIDGPIAVNKCVGGENRCSYTEKAVCSMHNIMMEINNHIREKLESVTLDRLC